MPLINPELTESQNWSKLSKNNIFHVATSNLWPRLTPEVPKNSNFDLTTRTSWDQRHYKDYWIPFPTTTHGSKSELERLRYPGNREKRINLLPNAITFIWPLEFQRFLETLRLAPSEFWKAFKYASEVKPKRKLWLLMSALDLAATKGPPAAGS